jgi:hypothetical protein
MDGKEWIAVAAFALAVITFLWRLKDQFSSYLQVSLQIDNNRRNLSLAKVTISNASVALKKVSCVFLLIGPMDKDPIDNLAAGQGFVVGCA